MYFSGVPKKAEKYLVQAEKYQAQTNRERLTIKAAQEWLGGDKMKCMETFEEVNRNNEFTNCFVRF